MFKVHLLLKDLTKPSVDVYLKIRLSGVGVDIRTVDGFIPSQTLRLIPGQPVMLTASDLAEYFNIYNLVVDGVDISDLYNGGRLPEGLYTWTVEAYEIDRNRQVSNTGMALMNVFKNYPPIINIPQDGAILPITTPQNVLFSWTSRSTASLNAAQGKTYKLRIYELSDGDDANIVANSGIAPFREIVTTNPYFAYGSAEPMLNKGHKYAIQVQEEDANGVDDYENEGKSQVVTFSYGKPCLAPEGMVINPIGKGRVELTAPLPPEGESGYPITAWYKQTGTVVWNSLPINNNSAVISGLKDKTEYEFKLSSACGDNSNTMAALRAGDLLPSGDPSTEPETFKIDDSAFDEEEPEIISPAIFDPYGIGIELNSDGTTRPIETLDGIFSKIIKPKCVTDADAYVECSPTHPDAPAITGTIELDALAVGDVLGIYDYAVLVTATIGSSPFSGKGLVKLPFLDNSFMAVEFSGIKAKKGEAGTQGGCVYEVGDYFRNRNISQSEPQNEQIKTIAAIIKLTEATVFHGDLEVAIKKYQEKGSEIASKGTATPQERQDLLTYTKGVEVAIGTWKDKFSEVFGSGETDPKIAEILGDMTAILTQLNTDKQTIESGTPPAGTSYPTIPDLKAKINAIIEKIKALQQENTPKPPRIQNVLATNIGYNDATLTWQGDPRFTKYVISYKTADGGELIETVSGTPPGGNRLDLKKLQENSQYGFKIEGYVGDEVLDRYENGAFKTLQNKLPMPENVKLLKKDDNTITLTWDNNKLHESYKIVYKDKNGVDRFIPIKNNTNTVTLTELNPEEKYEYSIVAVGGNLESDPATGGFMSGMCHGLIVSEVNRVIEGTRITLSVLDDCVSDISWNTGSTEPTIFDVPRETTTYIATCTIKKGVTTKTCKDEVTIIVDKKCAEVVATTLTNEVEQGDPVILRATGCESEIKWEKGYLSNIIVGNTKTLTVYPVESSIYSVSCQDLKGSTCYSQTQLNVNCTLKLISNPSENHNITFGESGSVIITAIGCVGGRLEWDLDAERFIKGEVIKPNQFRVSDIRRNKKATVDATCYLGNKECHADEIEVTRPAAICGNAAEYQHTVLSNVDNQLLINIFSKNIGDTWGPQIESIKWSQDGEYSVKGEKVSSRSYERNSYFRKYFPVPQKSVIFEYVVNYQDPAATCSFSVPYTPKIGDKNNVPTYPCSEFSVKVSENPTICQPISFTTNCPSVLTWDTPSIIENKVTITTPGSYSYKATCIVDGISVNKTVNFNVTQKPFKIDNVPTTTIEQGEKITFSANCNSGCKDGNIVWKSPDGQIIGADVGNSSITRNPTSVGSITYTAECTVDGIKQSDSKTISVKAGIQIPPANPCDFSVTFDKQVYGVGDFIEFIIYPSGNYTVYTNGNSENPTPEVTCSNTGTYVRCKSAQPLSALLISNKSIFPFDYNAQYKIVNNAIGVGSCTQLFSQYVLANKKSIVNINLNDFKPKTNTPPSQGKKNCDAYGQGSPNSCLGMPYNAPDGKLNWIEDTGNFGVFGIYNNEAGSFGRGLGRTPESIGLVDKSCSSANGRVTWYTDYNQPSIGLKSILNIYEVTKVPTPITKTVYLGRCVYDDGSYCHTTLTFDPSVTTQKVCSPSKSLREENTEENLKTIASEEAVPCLPVKVIEAAKFILTDVLCNKLKSIQGDEELKLTTLSAILAEQGIQLSAITPSIIQDLKDGKCSSVVEQLTSGITGSSTIENINEILKDSDGILNDVLDEIDRNKVINTDFVEREIEDLGTGTVCIAAAPNLRGEESSACSDYYFAPNGKRIIVKDICGCKVSKNGIMLQFNIGAKTYIPLYEADSKLFLGYHEKTNFESVAVEAANRSKEAPKSKLNNDWAVLESPYEESDINRLKAFLEQNISFLKPTDKTNTEKQELINEILTLMGQLPNGLVNSVEGPNSPFVYDLSVLKIRLQRIINEKNNDVAQIKSILDGTTTSCNDKDISELSLPCKLYTCVYNKYDKDDNGRDVLNGLLDITTRKRLISEFVQGNLTSGWWFGCETSAKGETNIISLIRTTPENDVIALLDYLKTSVSDKEILETLIDKVDYGALVNAITFIEKTSEPASTKYTTILDTPEEKEKRAIILFDDDLYSSNFIGKLRYKFSYENGLVKVIKQEYKGTKLIVDDFDKDFTVPIWENVGQPYTLNPYDLVTVHNLSRLSALENDMGMNSGQTYEVPAIVLPYIAEQEATNAIFQSINLASIFVGSGPMLEAFQATKYAGVNSSEAAPLIVGKQHHFRCQ
jgi:hypothetical protein